MTSPRRLRALLIRIWHQCVRRQADHDFAAELESHLQFQIDDNLRAGMSRLEARRHAVPALLVGTAFVACFVPGRRASRIFPLSALRDE